MNDQQAEHVIVAAMSDILVTVKDLLDKRRLFPALVLLYSALDILGSLIRPKTNADSSSKDFQMWVNRYLLRDPLLPATSVDLWGARCGILHTNSPNSPKSRRGRSKSIHYVIGDKDFAAFAQQTLPTDSPSVIVDVDILFAAFTDGIAAFARDVQTDTALRDTVLFHASSMFSLCDSSSA